MQPSSSTDSGAKTHRINRQQDLVGDKVSEAQGLKCYHSLSVRKWVVEWIKMGGLKE